MDGCYSTSFGSYRWNFFNYFKEMKIGPMALYYYKYVYIDAPARPTQHNPNIWISFFYPKG